MVIKHSYLFLYYLLFQLKVLALMDQSTYVPLKDVTIGGIIMVQHVKPGSEEELVEPVAGICQILLLELRFCDLVYIEINLVYVIELTTSRVFQNIE